MGVVHLDRVVLQVLITLPLVQQALKVPLVDHKDKKEPKEFRTSVYKDSKVLLALVLQVLQVLQGFKELKEIQE